MHAATRKHASSLLSRSARIPPRCSGNSSSSSSSAATRVAFISSSSSSANSAAASPEASTRPPPTTTTTTTPAGPPGIHLALDGRTPIPSDRQQHQQQQQQQQHSTSTSSDDAEWARNLRRLRRERKERAEAAEAEHSTTATSKSQFSEDPSSSSSSSLLSSSILSALVASGASLGHAPSRLNPAFTPYLYGQRSGLHLIDLERATVPLLRQAASLVRDVVKADGNVLFVGTRPEHRRSVQMAAERLDGNGFAVAGTKWLAGTLTNSSSM